MKPALQNHGALGQTAGNTNLTPMTCPLCRGVEFELHLKNCFDRRHWRPGIFEIYRCKACQVLVTKPWPVGDELAAYYPSDYVSFAPRDQRPSRLARALRSLVRLPYVLRYGSVNRTPSPPRLGSVLLDIGSGAGSYLHQMKELGWRVYGIEPSPAVAAAAARAAGISLDAIFVGSTDEAHWPDATFDLITLSHVLEHLSQPLRTLEKINRWLRPGGMVRIWLPNVESAESRIFAGLWFGLDIPRHLVHYSPATVRQLLQNTGFEVKHLVPEYQGSSLSGSLRLTADALSRRHRSYRHSNLLYYATLPLASLLLSLGNSPTIDVTAKKL